MLQFRQYSKQQHCFQVNIRARCDVTPKLTAWHLLHIPPSCQMIIPPKLSGPPHHAGAAALSARHQYLPAVLPGCNLQSFNLLIVSLDLVIVADLFVQLLYPLCEGHVIPLPERADALHFGQICSATSIFKLYLEVLFGLFFFHRNPTLSIFLLLLRHSSQYIFSRYT